MQAAGYSYRWFCNTLCDAEKQQAQENEKNVYDILNHNKLFITKEAITRIEEVLA